MYQVGTNNVVKEVYEKYKPMIRKIKDNRRQLIPSYDVGPLVLSRMLGINTSGKIM